MTTTGQRLAERSHLVGVSAATHLKAIKQSGLTAGAMLVSSSALPTATAMQHLLSSISTAVHAANEYWIKIRRGRR